MTRSCYDRVYNVFNEGDEVYTTSKYFKSIKAYKPYIVLKCYKPTGFIDDFPGFKIDIMTDRGFISGYASDRFFKTDSQLRHDKIIKIIDSF